MVIYEVNLEIRKPIKEAFVHWLDSHIKKMLCFDGFKYAKVYRLWPSDEETLHPESYHACIHYFVENREKLENYFIENATEMRSEALEKFGNSFTAHRRILYLEKELT